MSATNAAFCRHCQSEGDETQKKNPCGFTQETLLSQDIKLEGTCPGCKHPLGSHPTQAVQTAILAAQAKDQAGSQPQGKRRKIDGYSKDTVSKLRDQISDCKQGGMVFLPDGTPIFVRGQYIELLEYWKKLEHRKGFCLLGAPGVGKSMFAKLTFHLEMTPESNVLFASEDEANGNWTYQLFVGETVWELASLDEVYEKARPQDLIIIVDSRTSMLYFRENTVFKKVLVVHSPSGNHSRTVKHKNIMGRVLILEPSEREELIQMFKAFVLYKGKADMVDQFLGNIVSIKELKKRYAYCGGSIRNIQYPEDDLVSYLRDGIRKMTGINVQDFVRKDFGTSTEPAHRILHFYSGFEKECKVLTRFCSAWAENEVITSMAKLDETALLRQVDIVDVEGSLRGNIFENRVHCMMRNPGTGVTVTAKSIHKDTTETQENQLCILFKSSKGFDHFDDLESLEILVDTYYYPKSRNFRTVDAFFVTQENDEYTLWLMQMTVSKKHTVKLEGLNYVIGHVQKSLMVKEHGKRLSSILAFTVPPSTYEKFEGYQTVTIGTWKQQKPASEANQKIVQQQVWHIDKVDGKSPWPK